MMRQRTGCCGDPRQLPETARPFSEVWASRRRGAHRCGDGFTYRVQPGDTIYALGHEFGVPWEAIFSANPFLGSPTRLIVGQVICIPTLHIPRCPDGVLYELEEGETPRAVAEKLDIALEQLLELNPQVANPDRTFPGQRLCVPLGQDGSGGAANG